MAIAELPWKKPVGGPSFNQEYLSEYRASDVPNGGLGWWAKVDIPKGTRMRKVTLKDKTLHRFENEAELRATGWDIDDAVNYGIGHASDRSAIFYLDPGTACNHADRTRKASVQYNMTQKGMMEIWTIRDVKAGEEMFIDYGISFSDCDWFLELMLPRGLTPLSRLADEIEKMYQTPGTVEMKVTSKKSPGFYAKSASSFLEGFTDKDGNKKEPVKELSISGVGDAMNTVAVAATSVEKAGCGKIKEIETSYPEFVTFGANGPVFRSSARLAIKIANAN